MIITASQLSIKYGGRLYNFHFTYQQMQYEGPPRPGSMEHGTVLML